MVNYNAKFHTVVLLPPTLTESFEICLARIVDLRKEQQSVEAIVCNGRVKGCVTNILKIEGICQHCIKVRNEALNIAAPDIETSSLDDFYMKANVKFSAGEYSKITDGATSTITTFYRRDIKSPMLNWLGKCVFKRVCNAYFEHSVFIANALCNFFKSKRCDCFEFFNGRIVPSRAAMTSAQKFKKDFNLLEVTGKKKKLTLIHNNSVHDINFQHDALKAYIKNRGKSFDFGQRFFEARRNNEVTNDVSFTGNQENGLLSLSGKPILAIFTSSADELRVAGNQWFTTASEDPTSFIKEVAKQLGKDYRIIVRMHPNQAGDRTGAAKDMLDTLRITPDVEVISPNSKVSSYELLDLSQVVLTFGSTIGLEATFWGKPSLLAGRAVWEILDVCYQIETAKEISSLLENKLKPCSRTEAVKVGAYYLEGMGYDGSLGWKIDGSMGFSVDRQNFLSKKRDSIFYWLSRLSNRALRL